MPYDRSDESLAVLHREQAPPVPAPAIGPERAASTDFQCASAANLRELMLPYRSTPRPLQSARRDFEVAARAIPRSIVEQALSTQLSQDGGRAFAQRVARIHSKAAPCRRNEIVALLLIGCGPAALVVQAYADCSVEALAAQAAERGGDSARHIAELCVRTPALALALDHVDLAEVLGRLLTWTGLA